MLLTEDTILQAISDEYSISPCGGCSRGQSQPVLGCFGEIERITKTIEKGGIIEGVLRCAFCSTTKHYALSVGPLLGKVSPT